MFLSVTINCLTRLASSKGNLHPNVWGLSVQAGTRSVHGGRDELGRAELGGLSAPVAWAVVGGHGSPHGAVCWPLAPIRRQSEHGAQSTLGTA